jgi:hypothetical protein
MIEKLKPPSNMNPTERLDLVIKNYKLNLKKLYRLEDDLNKGYEKQYQFVCGQEKVLELLFGSEFLEKLTNETWDEYYELGIE